MEADIFSGRKFLKDNKISVMLHIPGKGGEYRITLEWFASTKELSEKTKAGAMKLFEQEMEKE